MRPTALLALFAAGCFATGYKPQPGPGIQVTVSGVGSPVFSEGGKEIQTGYFGTSLTEKMKGTPEAEGHVRTWRERRLVGFTLSIVASAITILGVATIDPGAGFSARNTFSVAAILGGSFPISLASTLFNLSADSHLQDGLNLYNDAARKRAGVRVGPGGLAVVW